MAYTDNEGRYMFQGLPTATYNITVAPGTHRALYLSGGYGMAYAGPAGSARPKPIELADGQQLENVDVALTRAGAITGTVTDASGDPASRVQVSAMLVRRGAEPAQVGSVSTDDLGQFRLFGLAPADYILVASAQQMGFGGPIELEGEATGFAPTYAPGTPTPSDAVRVRLPRGGQATADIRLIETRVFMIKGTVITSAGTPPRNANVSVIRADTPNTSSGTGVMPDGTFVIRNLPPGQYDLIARYTPQREGLPPGGPMPTDNSEMVSVRVEVGGSDVDGIILATEPGATVVGQVVFEDGQSEGRRVQIFTQPAERRTFMSSPAVEVKDSTFTIRNMFGRHVIRGNVIGSADVSGGSLGLKAVMLNGRDITDEPRVFTNADSGKLQVVFTLQAPALDGTVTDDAGRPVQECTILLLGDDAATWQPGSSMIRQTRPMKDGKFRFRGLREGRYRIVALPSVFTFNQMTPDVQLLEALSKLATPVVLNAGETRTVDLKLTPFEQ